MDAQTRENIFTALHGEAFAHARYMLYAEAARNGGDERLAGMFEGIAGVELREHFQELAGSPGSSAPTRTTWPQRSRTKAPKSRSFTAPSQSRPGVPARRRSLLVSRRSAATSLSTWTPWK